MTRSTTPGHPSSSARLLFINAGAMLVTASNELVFLFVGLELVSIPTYLLLYLSRRNSRALRKRRPSTFFLSIFSSGLLLFGLAYLYGMTGSATSRPSAILAQAPNSLGHVPHPILGVIALVFVMAGLGFRVAAVPFHFYAPDVYEGSPTILAALLAWVPKGIGFVAILRTPGGRDSDRRDRTAGQRPDQPGRRSSPGSSRWSR